MRKNIKISLCLSVIAVTAVGCSGDSGESENFGVGGVNTAVGGATGVTSAGGGSTAITSAALGGQVALGGQSAVAGGGAAGASTSAPPAGGSVGTGGVAAAGGTTAKGGATSAGGTTAKGGATSAGGTTAKGGATSAGGTTAKGGSTSVGGTTAKGGSTSVGGTTAKGGSTSAGGTTAKGGTTSVGGTTGTGGTTSPSNEIWISPTGSDTNPGTKAAPLFSLCDTTNKVGACYKLCPNGTACTAGTIWVMNGTYQYKTITQKTTSSFAGTASGIIKVFAESGAKPVFDFTGMAVASTSRGLQLGGDYWHIKGITVTKAGDTGIFVMGSHITVEQCVAHHNQDAGFVIGVNSSAAGSGQYNTILNCDSYLNNDSATNGENADGFGLKENTGVGNVFRGCRAWDNADDGWDLYAWASPVTIDNCWAMSNCKTTKGSASDGNGFKLGGDGVSAKHVLSNLYATDNAYGTSGRGFTNNSNPASMSCTGTCASWSNKAADTGVSGVGTSAPSGATAAKMIAATRLADGSLPAITSL